MPGPKCPTTKHHVCKNLILNHGCLQKYNNNENIHVDNNEIKLYQKTYKKMKIEKMIFMIFEHIYPGT